MNSIYIFLDYFFVVFHTVLIAFNLFGWLWPGTRKLNLASLILTLLSWFVLGIWYGFGYCPCTDWHWQVRAALGKYDMPASYIKFLLDKFTGMDWNAALVDGLTVASLLIAVCCSVIVNSKDRKRKK